MTWSIEDGVAAVAAYLDEHYADDVTMVDLGRIARFSPWYLSRHFRRIMGTSPGRYRTRARVEAVKRLLETTDRPAGRIATEVGVASGGSGGTGLWHQFRRVTGGQSPGRYRAELRAERIERAKRLLETTDRSWREIASLVGEPAPEALRIAFRRQVGLAPNYYRDKHRERTA